MANGNKNKKLFAIKTSSSWTKSDKHCEQRTSSVVKLFVNGAISLCHLVLSYRFHSYSLTAPLFLWHFVSHSFFFLFLLPLPSLPTWKTHSLTRAHQKNQCSTICQSVFMFLFWNPQMHCFIVSLCLCKTYMFSVT